MNNNDGGAVFVLFSLTCGLFCGLPILLILTTALLSNYLERARQTVYTHTWQSFLLGLINFVFFFTIGAIFAEAGLVPLKAFALLSLFIVLPLMMLTGLVVAASIAGERVVPLFTDKTVKPLVSLIVGIICLGFSAIVPIVGWAMLGVLMMIGFGAALVTLFRRNGHIDISPVNSPPELTDTPNAPTEESN